MAQINTTTCQCVIFLITKNNIFSDTTFLGKTNLVFLNKYSEIYVGEIQSVTLTSQLLKDTELHIQKIKNKQGYILT